MLKYLVQTAPDLKVSGDLLQQTVAWSSGTKHASSLKEFIAARAPKTAKALRLSPTPDVHVPRVNELSEEELVEVVCRRLKQGTEGLKLAVLGSDDYLDDYSGDELVQEVRSRTALGRRLMATERRSIELVESLAESGKLRYSESNEEAIVLPDFPF